MMEQLIVNGERTEASDRQTFDVYDPSSGDVLASVAKATTADVDHEQKSDFKNTIGVGEM